MSRLGPWTLIVSVVLAVSCFGQTPTELTAQADALFAQLWITQYTLSDAPQLREMLEEAMQLYAQALIQDPAYVPALNMLARCHYTLADMFVPEKEKAAIHAKGQEYGERALRADPEFVRVEKESGFAEAVKVSSDIAALFWTYSNWARKVDLGGAVGLIGAVLRGDDKKLLALMERCLELDRGYIAGGPLRAVAGYWAKHPLSKDPVKVRTSLEEAISAYPDYLENQLFYAEYYLIPAEMWVEAKARLQAVIDAPLSEDALEDGHVKILALDLLSLVEGKLP